MTLLKNIKVSFKKVDELPRYSDENNKSGLIGYYNQYKVKVTFEGRSATFDYGSSVHNYNEGIEPKKEDLLYCLVSDYNSPNNFENFCDEFGYDQDSRKAEKIFKAIQKEATKLDKIFPNREIEDLDLELRENGY